MNEKIKKILSYLGTLPATQWETGPPAADKDIDELETRFQFQLPPDYKYILNTGNGAWLYGFSAQLGMDPIKKLWDLNEDPYISGNLPGMFAFAGDGGGHLYFFDKNNRLEHGQNAVFWAPMGSMYYEDATYLGGSITEVIERLLNNEDFYALPALGEEK
jgi:hypothetical protein